METQREARREARPGSYLLRFLVLVGAVCISQSLKLNMAILKVGKPLPLAAARPFLGYVREHGVRQFNHTFHRVEAAQLGGAGDDALKWGDEVEYGIFRLEGAPGESGRGARLSLRGPEVMEELNRREAEQVAGCCQGAKWMPEYGAWMVESTPAAPYSGYSDGLTNVELNMRKRRARLLTALRPGEVAPTLTNFPLLGADPPAGAPRQTPPPPPGPGGRGGGEEAAAAAAALGGVGGPVAGSRYLPDAVIHPHPRFGTLTQNIRKRRGSNVDIRIPLFNDTFTPEFQNTKEVDAATAGIWAPTADGGGGEGPCVHMDAMAFGMGCCCVQLTFQAKNLDESRFLYDQLGVLAPLFMALTAATPIHRGRLVATDARWQAISASVDDRTPAEAGRARPPAGAAHTPDPDLAGGGVRRLPKSRYDSISCFLQSCREPKDKYNDVEAPRDEEAYRLLLEAGVDSSLAHHVAHLFTRDPLVIFEGNVEEVDDEKATDHWDNIQSTNWQTVRWKPPPAQEPGQPEIGWRVELRSMEVQLTDFENAAFVVFAVLLTRVLLAWNLNLYVPVSKVDENMRRAHTMNAVLTEKFWFRTAITSNNTACCCAEDDEGLEQPFEELDLKTIMLGKEDKQAFPGLITLVEVYAEKAGFGSFTRSKIEGYLDYLKKRASGELWTPARYLRDFVTRHQAYRKDSVVSPEIAHDLLRHCAAVGEGRIHAPKLLGETVIREINLDVDAWQTPIASQRFKSSWWSDLQEVYANRQSFEESHSGGSSSNESGKNNTKRKKEEEERGEMTTPVAECRNETAVTTTAV